jgi:phage protein
MDDCTKVLVYGSFDGFAHSTDSSLLISVVLDGGEKVEVPEEFIVSADQMVNKYKIKLKDVIARIEKFDLATKAVWINEILNELGSEYGAFKYKASYEQGKFDGAMEHEKVTIPQFVADYIDLKKTYDFHVYGAMRVIEDHYDKRVQEWFYEGNIETFARAWLDGYTVEKEPKYTVKFKANKQYLSNDEIGLHFDPSFRSNFTKSDLEKLGLGWVFDCEGMEVEKVGK